MIVPKPCVLSFSHDYSLLITRQLLLEKIDCTVLCAMSVPELRERMQWKQVDVLVLCQTLTPDECGAAHVLIRRHAPQANCLAMYTGAQTYCLEETCSSVLRTSDGPLAFLRAVRKLLPVQPFPPPTSLHQPVPGAVA